MIFQEHLRRKTYRTRKGLHEKDVKKCRTEHRKKVKTINAVSIKSRRLRLTDRREHSFSVKQAKAGVEALGSKGTHSCILLHEVGVRVCVAGASNSPMRNQKCIRRGSTMGHRASPSSI